MLVYTERFLPITSFESEQAAPISRKLVYLGAFSFLYKDWLLPFPFPLICQGLGKI